MFYASQFLGFRYIPYSHKVKVKLEIPKLNYKHIHTQTLAMFPLRMKCSKLVQLEYLPLISAKTFSPILSFRLSSLDLLFFFFSLSSHSSLLKVIYLQINPHPEVLMKQTPEQKPQVESHAIIKRKNTVTVLYMNQCYSTV